MGDAIHQDWESNPDVEILHVLDQINQPYSCSQWGDEGSIGIPPIIIGESSVFFNLFQHPGDGSSRPLVVFINHEMEIIFISDNHVTQTDAYDLINLMLDNCGDNCDDPLSTINISMPTSLLLFMIESMQAIITCAEL